MQLTCLSGTIRSASTRWLRRKRETRSILINARLPMEYAMMAPVHNALREDDRLSFYFTSTGQQNHGANTYREASHAVRMISPARAATMKFDAYLAADLLWMRLPRGACRIQMFHGVAGKYSNTYDTPQTSMRKWDRFFFINRRRLRNFVAAGAIDAGSPAARLIGMPKVDCLVDGSLERDRVLRSLRIDPGRRTVLYAPTWTRYSSLLAFGEDVVRDLCREGYGVMIKLHDNSRDPNPFYSGGIDWAARLEPIVRESGGCLATGSDSCSYLAAADVLITDHSSIGFEYLLLDRPLIRIEMPELTSRTNTNHEYVRLLSEVSTTVRNHREALIGVERALADPAQKSSSRRAVADELFFKPGTATARAVREIYEVLALDPAIPVRDRQEIQT